MSETMRVPPSGRDAREWAFFAGAFAFYTALGVWKMRAYVLEGRFWAEEGMMLFVQMAALPFPERLAYLVYGHLMLPANLVVALATLVPLEIAPLVTSHLSFVLQSIPVVMMLLLRRELGLERWAAIAVAVVLVGLPQAPEMWATTVALHFHFSLVAALVALADTTPGARRPVFRALLVVCGLSGIPANFIAPVFLMLALATRDRERWVQFAILAATAAFQVALLLYNSSATGPRTISWDPRVYWLSIVAQQTLSPLFGIDVGDRLAGVLRLVFVHHAGAVLFALVCSIPLFLFVREGVVSGAWRVRALVASALLLSLLGIFGSIGDRVAFISAGGGGRYFFASNVLVAILLLGLAGSRRGWILRAFVAVLLLASLLRVPDYLGGPPWRAELEASTNAGADQIRIWPAPWTMRNPGRR